MATVAGVATLWPGDERPEAPYSAPGVTYPRGEVVARTPVCPVIAVRPGMDPEERPEFPDRCDQVGVRLLDGAEEGRRVTLGVPPGISEVLRNGDQVRLIAVPGDPVSYNWFGVVRNAPIGWMTALFVAVVAVVARARGLLALVGLLFAGAVMGWFMLPALLTGESGIGVALAGSSLIMFVVLYLAHGPSVRTSTALAGTLLGLGVTSGLGVLAISATRLTGLGDESGLVLRSQAPELDFAGLLTCAVIVAGLGVLNDVTITQSSAVWELRSVAPELSRVAVFRAGMRIGRDHIASTIYTIVFAYAGTALAVLLLISLYDRPLLDVLSDDAIAEEVVRTLASAIGLVLAVPATTAIAALTVAAPSAQR